MTKLCPRCGEVKNLADFPKRPDRSRFQHKVRSMCWPCKREYEREYTEKHREQVNANKRRQYHRHRVKLLFREKLRKHNITAEEYHRLHQDLNCRICKLYLTHPEIDHDHKTGKVRGLLCGHCNKMIGLARENPIILLAAVDYLSFPEPPNRTLLHRTSAS